MMNDTVPNQRLGRFVTTSVVGGETVKAFVPPPLPPSPSIDLLSLLDPLGRADRALGELRGTIALVPNAEIFLYIHIRKEAVLSSQIEGTQSTLSNFLHFEAEAGEPIDDIREISNYVDAMMYGLDRLKTLPLSLRLICELHERLLCSGRGQEKNPGHFRRSQNWIGGTRPGNALFVPPPIREMKDCLHDLELFINKEEPLLPILIKAGLIHVQFETIHPFLDGNGRIGRLLITLFLYVQGVLREPLLYLSLFFTSNRKEYHRLLQEVRDYGAWEAWLEFFLRGVEKTAVQTSKAIISVVKLLETDREQIKLNSKYIGSSLRVYECFQQHPFLTAKQLSEKTKLSDPTVNKILRELVRLEIIVEVTGRRRGRIFVYKKYMNILDQGTHPLSHEE